MNRKTLATPAAAIALLILLIAWGRSQSKSPFAPPGETQRRVAVGSTSALDPNLKRAFDAGSTAFDPVSKPGPHDWLANHKEPGQTFMQFLQARRNRPDTERKVLYIFPLGEFDGARQEPSLEVLRAYSEAFFGMPTKLLPKAEEIENLPIETRVNRGTGKRQLLSTDILNLLPKKLPDDAFCMLAVTMQDLYPEESWNFVFGQASLCNRVGVFSFARYDPAFFGAKRGGGSKKLVLQRSCKVLVHETGHMFGIRHCIHFDCIMNGSNHLEESDAKPMHLCPACLRKLHHSNRFDPAKRYAKLAEIYGEHGFDDEEAWAKKRQNEIQD